MGTGLSIRVTSRISRVIFFKFESRCPSRLMWSSLVYGWGFPGSVLLQAFLPVLRETTKSYGVGGPGVVQRGTALALASSTWCSILFLTKHGLRTLVFILLIFIFIWHFRSSYVFTIGNGDIWKIQKLNHSLSQYSKESLTFFFSHLTTYYEPLPIKYFTIIYSPW